MKFSTLYDFDVIALQQEETLTCLIQFEAPIPTATKERPAECVIPVVDRSGSMGGAPIAACRQALHTLVDRMKPQDVFGLVTFNHEAQIHIPARPIADHDIAVVHGLINSIYPEGTTDLSAGYLLGLDLAKRSLQQTGASIILLSDGHANEGITDLTRIGDIARSASADRITSTTIGIGEGYDERLLDGIATQGGGNHRFAHTTEDAISILSEESGDLLNKSIINAFLRIVPNDPALIPGIGTLQEVRRWVDTNPDGKEVVVIPLGDIYAGEMRELLVQFQIPGITQLGAHSIGDFVIEFVTLPDLESSKITWPISVNVGTEDQAKSRVPNPTVTTAMLITESAKAKREASENLRNGESDIAGNLITEKAILFQTRIDQLPLTPEYDPLRQSLSAELDHLNKLSAGIREREANLMSKSLYEDSNMNLRGRNKDAMRQERSRGKREF